ncbi:MAG: GNAT family N-acetyltransferase [Lachnospiraceae bacterium]|nr:GNAT family N-acetyltransferase [Lachnospiraceae bacterium]
MNGYIDNEERWAIELKQIRTVIGNIGVCHNNNRGNYYDKTVSFVSAEEYRGSGYMTEALNSIIKYLFEETGVELITEYHYPSNNASKRVLEKYGFEYEGIIEQGCKRFDGEIMDAVCYPLLRSDYCEKNDDCYVYTSDRGSL